MGGGGGKSLLLVGKGEAVEKRRGDCDPRKDPFFPSKAKRKKGGEIHPVISLKGKRER